MGRGTTALQTALAGRVAYGSDINPLSEILTTPRLSPPSIESISAHFKTIPNDAEITEEDTPLLVFYHPKTLRHLLALKQWFMEHEKSDALTAEDKWIRMVAMNRLSGHSSGFLSVKTMPPNQTISIEQQRKINEKHERIPEEKDVFEIILKKSRSLLRSGTMFLQQGCHQIEYIEDGEVVITSPPFMNIVNYDNWPAGIDVGAIAFDDGHSSVADWERFVRDVFVEFSRVIKSGGHVVFEVGEVQKGAIKLEENVIEAIKDLPFDVKEVLVNEQQFTKTANCWGVKNNEGGTNTNRIIVAKKI